MGPFFHVLVTERGREHPRYLMDDLDAKSLKGRLRRPYKAGGKIVVGNALLDLSSLGRGANYAHRLARG